MYTQRVVIVSSSLETPPEIVSKVVVNDEGDPASVPVEPGGFYLALGEVEAAFPDLVWRIGLDGLGNVIFYKYDPHAPS
jgi:hypothetical protein